MIRQQGGKGLGIMKEREREDDSLSTGVRWFISDAWGYVYRTAAVQQQYRTEQKSHITKGMQQYSLVQNGVMRYMETVVELYCRVVELCSCTVIGFWIVL